MSGTLTRPFLRTLTAADRGRIEEISRAVGVFRDDEIPVALEVFDGAVAGSPDYLAHGAEHDGRLAGGICWGPTPSTLGILRKNGRPAIAVATSWPPAPRASIPTPPQVGV